MTLREFNLLSPDHQTLFIESGELLSPELPPNPTQGYVSVGSEVPERQSVKGCVPLESSESASSHSSGEQTVPPSTMGAPPEGEGSRENDHDNTTEEDSAHFEGKAEEGISIEDPVELLFLLDDDIASGKVKLHKWQVEFLLDFARGGKSDANPFQSIVRAANGSGKDKYIIAPCVVWLCMRYKKARAIVTSSSGVQLDNQTCAYIDILCNAANAKFGPIWKVNYRYYECLATESPIVCFATDEPGKAEGYHPLSFGAKMVLMESEAKTVPDDIHHAMSRCTGYTHRCLVSTPGLPMGHFFNLDSTAISRKELEDICSVGATDYIRYHITAFDCDHIPRSNIEIAKRDLPGGEHGSAYKSRILAEFGTTDEMVVIPYIHVWSSVTKIVGTWHTKWLRELFNKAGLDLSDGGDETVLTVRNGNRHLITIPFRFDNTEDTVQFLVDKFEEWDLNHKEAIINADCGGLGKPILDRIYRMGWTNIRYIDNRSKAQYPKTYLNRGTELWFHVRKLLEGRELIIENDATLVRQLSTRYYKITSSNVHQLLSKLESRSRGYPSPDRGDSFVLCFWDYKSTHNEPNFISNPEEFRDKLPFELAAREEPQPTFTIKSWVRRDNWRGQLDRFRTSKDKDFSFLREEIAAYSQTINKK